MPRYDCNTPHRNRGNHRRMRSGHKGMGGDRKLKAAKRVIAEAMGHHRKPKRGKKDE